MKAIVFAGPSLPPGQRPDDPWWDWRPPVRQGELYRAALTLPAAIGVVDGREAIVIEHVTRLAPDVAPEWPTLPGALGYRVVITGQPDIDCTMAATVRDRKKAGIESMTSGAGAMVATAMRVVNAVPYVVAAQPGLLSSVDLPLTIPQGAFTRSA